MNHLNSILIEGNLQGDPEISYTPKGSCICNFTLVSERYVKVDDGGLKKERSQFPVVCYSRMAEVCGEYLRAGRGVRLVGRITQEGEKGVCIVAEHVEFKPKMVNEERGGKE